MSSEILAIIPARGGSKGIPRKNLQPLFGRPLVAYTVGAALAASTVTRVVVSTDNDEIAAVAVSCGAEVVQRPPELAGDTASSESALLHVLDHLRDSDGYEPELVVFLQATSPLRATGGIDGAVQYLLDEDADSLFSACPTHGFVWRRSGSSLQSISYDFTNRQRRQDIGLDLLENGSIYVFKPWVLRETGNRLGGDITVFEMDPLDSFQVDDPGDFGLMEALMSVGVGMQMKLPDLSKVRLLVLDFDGVMTDDRVIVNQDGVEAVMCHRGDGFGIERVKHTGIEVIVLSKETNRVVAARCAKLGIGRYQGFDKKLSELQRLVGERGLSPEQLVYVGNDVNDLECVRWAGVGIAVADANPKLAAVANWVTTQPGGNGAVREVCDAIIAQRVKE